MVFGLLFAPLVWTIELTLKLFWVAFVLSVYVAVVALAVVLVYSWRTAVRLTKLTVRATVATARLGYRGGRWSVVRTASLVR